MAIPIIAHRACPLHAPENSIAGIRAAAEQGADGVEIDVQRTLDGVPVLLHDWSPWRTARLPGPVWCYPSSLLRRVHLQQDTEHIPTLAEALDVLPETMFIAIELKGASTAPDALRMVRERRLEERVLFWSPRDEAVRYCAQEAPEIESSLLRDDREPEAVRRFLRDAQALGARGVSLHWDAVTPDTVRDAHERGLRVYSMTRGDLETVAEKAACGLDGIVTDYPREVRAILAEAGS